MARKNEPNLDRSGIDRILSEEEVGFLALRGDEYPYCIPLSYAFLDGRIVIHCALEGFKLDCIRADPRCCFTVSRGLDPVRPHQAQGRCDYRFESMVAIGRARVVEDITERLDLLRRFKDHFYRRLGLDPDGDPVSLEAARRCGCIVIEIDGVTGRRKGTIEPSPLPGASEP